MFKWWIISFQFYLHDLVGCESFVTRHFLVQSFLRFNLWQIKNTCVLNFLVSINLKIVEKLVHFCSLLKVKLGRFRNIKNQQNNLKKCDKNKLWKRKVYNFKLPLHKSKNYVFSMWTRGAANISKLILQESVMTIINIFNKFGNIVMGNKNHVESLVY